MKVRRRHDVIFFVGRKKWGGGIDLSWDKKGKRSKNSEEIAKLRGGEGTSIRHQFNIIIRKDMDLRATGTGGKKQKGLEMRVRGLSGQTRREGQERRFVERGIGRNARRCSVIWGVGFRVWG